MTVRLQICHLPERVFEHLVATASILSFLHIQRQGAELVAETSTARASPRPRREVQKYTLDGEISVSTGSDEDEFHTRVIRRRFLRGRYVQSHACALARFTSNLHAAAVEHHDALHN